MVESLSSDICKPSEHGEDVFLAPGMLEPVLPYFKYFYGKVGRRLCAPRFSALGPKGVLVDDQSRLQDIPPNEDGEARDRYLSTIRAHPCASALLAVRSASPS